MYRNTKNIFISQKKGKNKLCFLILCILITEKVTLTDFGCTNYFIMQLWIHRYMIKISNVVFEQFINAIPSFLQIWWMLMNLSSHNRNFLWENTKLWCGGCICCVLYLQADWKCSAALQIVFWWQMEFRTKMSHWDWNHGFVLKQH